MPALPVLGTSREEVAVVVMKSRGVWATYCHWSHLWWLMPEVAYRLADCLTAIIPDDKGRGALLGQCYVEAAAVIDAGWPHSMNAFDLVSDALRAMFLRAIDAAEYEVHLDGAVWNPSVDGPLGRQLTRAGEWRPTVSRRDTDHDVARDAIHQLLAQHVYCKRCERNLHRSYAHLMRLGDAA